MYSNYLKSYNKGVRKQCSKKKVRNKVSNGRQEPTELAREFKKQVQAKKNK